MQMRKFVCVWLCLLAVLFVFFSAFPQQAAKLRTDGNKVKAHIEYLASDELEGRQTLTPGYQKAADYVAARFKEYGLAFCGDNGTSYFQKVPISRAVTVNDGIPSFIIDNRVFDFDDNDFTMNTLSTTKTTVKAEVIFVGYGISLPSKGLDEYSSVNVQGKVVLAFKGSPETVTAARGSFSGTPVVPPTPLGLTAQEITDQAKIRTAYDKGAAAILLYNPETTTTQTGGGGGGRGGAGGGLQGLQPTRNFIAFDITERVFRSIVKKSPTESASEYNKRVTNIRLAIKDRKLQSKATGVIAALKGYDDTKQYSGDGLNVIGKIEGTDPVLKNQYIVIGGHLDHLGVRNGVIMNGADDDASGPATVMEVARVLTQAQFKPKRTIVFAAWCGEEMGLLGSNYFGANPPAGITMDKVVADFNNDMVALGDNLGVPGALNFPTIWEVIKRDQDPDVMSAVRPSTAGPGGSDYSTFISKGIEALALMTGGGGGHPDYHDSGDDTYKCDPEILRKNSQFVLQGVINVANETTVNLLIPDRQYLYTALQMRITNINVSLPQSTWRYVDFTDRNALFSRIYEREIALSAQQAAQVTQAGGGRAGTPAAAPARGQAPVAATVRKDVAQGVRSRVFEGDVKLMELGANTLGFGRVEFSSDDGVWVVDGRLTDAGKSAIKSMENDSIRINLVNPSGELLNDVLSTAVKPLIITGTYNLTPAAVDLVKSKRVLVSVDYDPADVNGSINKADQLKKLLGGTANLIAYVKSTDKIDDIPVKQSFYLGLIKKGWTAEDVAGFIGGNLRTISGAAGGGGRRG